MKHQEEYEKALKVLLDLDNNIPIYLAGHLSPDQDSVGSCLSLARFLNHLGKHCQVLLNDSDRDLISWQGDYSLIVPSISEKKFNFIALDINQTYRLNNFEKYFKVANFTVNLDHHAGNTTDANFVLDLDDVSSTCEIIYHIISIYDKNLLDKKTCENLYAGIMTDTNCFSRRIGENALVVAQDLINHGINYDNINKQTLWKRSKDELFAVGKLSQEIKNAKGFKYVIADQNEERIENLTFNDLTKKVAEDLRKRNDLNIFIMFVVNKNNEISAKVMTNLCDKADKIASIMGGGGHKKEAGFKSDTLTIPEIIEKIEQNLNNI